jgi:hypothetical protein
MSYDEADDTDTENRQISGQLQRVRADGVAVGRPHHLETTFEKLVGRKATHADRLRLYEKADALKLKPNDAVWDILILVDEVERTAPKCAEASRGAVAAVVEAAKTAEGAAVARIKAAAQEAETMTKATSGEVARGVREGAVAAAQLAARGQMFKGIAISIGVACLALGAIGWFAYDKGHSIGFAEGWATGKGDKADAAAAAVWTNTPEGKLAWSLARVGGTSIHDLALCAGKGWQTRTQKLNGKIWTLCFPYAEDNIITGWIVDPVAITESNRDVDRSREK